MAQPAGDDTAKKARRHTERVIKSLHPPTRTGKLIVWVAPYIVGPVVEHGVRFAEERGPELAGKGAAIARQKAPVVAAAAREKAPVVVAAVRERTPEVVHAATQTARDRAERMAVRLRERRAARRARRGRKGSGTGQDEPAEDWGGYEEPTRWDRGR